MPTSTSILLIEHHDAIYNQFARHEKYSQFCWAVLTLRCSSIRDKGAHTIVSLKNHQLTIKMSTGTRLFTPLKFGAIELSSRIAMVGPVTGSK